MAQLWKPIAGTAYEVSDLGQVRRVGRFALRPRVQSNGYHRVALGAGKDAYVHRLVAAAFHGPAPEGAHAHHIDGNRANNAASNLQWLSPDANRELRQCARGSAHWQAKLDEYAVRAIRASPEASKVLAIAFGVTPRTINDARSGKLWRHVQ